MHHVTVLRIGLECQSYFNALFWSFNALKGNFDAWWRQRGSPPPSYHHQSPPLQIDMGTERIWSLILRIWRKQPAWYICDQSLTRKRKNSWSFTNIQNYKVFAGSRGKYRSIQQRCSVEKCVPRNFTKFTRKHLCQSLFFNKVAGLKPATLLKKVLTQVFSCEFCEISKNTFFTEHIWTTASEVGPWIRLDKHWLFIKLVISKYFRKVLNKYQVFPIVYRGRNWYSDSVVDMLIIMHTFYWKRSTLSEWINVFGKLNELIWMASLLLHKIRDLECLMEHPNGKVCWNLLQIGRTNDFLSSG